MFFKREITIENWYLLDIALILISTKILGLLSQKFRMPQVVGALLAGIILGPCMLNVITTTKFLKQLGEIGVIGIMFSAGMETDIKELKQSSFPGFLVALSGAIIPLIMGTSAVLVAANHRWIPLDNRMVALFIGTILTATSVSITVETLKELGKLFTKVGNTILAAALIDDVLGMIALAIINSLANGNGHFGLVFLRIVLFIFFALAVEYLMRPVYNYLSKSAKGKDLRLFPILAFALCLIMAFCAEQLFGIAGIIGAYASGLMISTKPKAKYIQSRFEPLTYLLLTPIFFTGIGLKVHITGMSVPMVWFTLLLLFVAIISKLLGCGLGAKICGYTNRQSLQVGVGMACRGEVALVVANQGIEIGLLPAEMMTPIVISVVLIAIIAPVLLKFVFTEEYTLDKSSLADHYVETKQLDYVSAQLLEKNREIEKQREVITKN